MALSRSLATHPSFGQHIVSQLQHSHGNRHVQRLLHVARQATGGSEVEPGVEQEIHRARSSGQALDQGVRSQMESSFEADFSGVRVHTDAHADTLNRSLNARAFTTGQDVFFRQGAYNPGSSSGRELLAHELTHVVQQGGGAVRAKLAVNQPGDRFEQEADQAARAVIQREQQAGSAIKPGAQLQRQVEEEEEEPVQARFLQRQTDEEEEPVQARLLQRQVNEDDEAVQMQRLQRQTDEEEEPVQAQLLQRQVDEDDEAVQMQRLQRQTEDEEPIQTQIAQRQSEDEEPVQMMWIQRQAATATEPETVEAEPTEAEKAAALAAARVAEQLANQALAEGTNEVAKSQTALAEEKNVGQAAKQEAEARSPEVPAEAAYAAAAQTGGEEGEQPTGAMTDVMAIEPAAAPTTNGTGPATEIGPGAANGTGPGAVDDKAPASAQEDPAYQEVITRIKGVADTQQKHAPAKAKADESQAAAESPPSELAGKAQANQVDKMEQAEAPPFDAAAFKAQLMERIAALAPRTVEEADNFKKDNKLGGVKSDMQSKAQAEQAASQAPVARADCRTARCEQCGAEAGDAAIPRRTRAGTTRGGRYQRRPQVQGDERSRSAVSAEQRQTRRRDGRGRRSGPGEIQRAGVPRRPC